MDRQKDHKRTKEAQEKLKPRGRSREEEKIQHPYKKTIHHRASNESTAKTGLQGKGQQQANKGEKKGGPNTEGFIKNERDGEKKNHLSEEKKIDRKG